MGPSTEEGRSGPNIATGLLLAVPSFFQSGKPVTPLTLVPGAPTRHKTYL